MKNCQDPGATPLISVLDTWIYACFGQNLFETIQFFRLCVCVMLVFMWLRQLPKTQNSNFADSLSRKIVHSIGKVYMKMVQADLLERMLDIEPKICPNDLSTTKQYPPEKTISVPLKVITIALEIDCLNMVDSVLVEGGLDHK